jgi:hypothetical protein
MEPKRVKADVPQRILDVINSVDWSNSLVKVMVPTIENRLRAAIADAKLPTRKT